ncbi:MAG: hypothetical protein EOO96_30920 [Pedobacter sp.]|nr:MAG: hypothetical protein EOO96_30920 [Pedobacter sp.]
MAIYPFIFIKRKEYKNDRILVNHERIHHQQQIELLVIPFYIIYLLNYIVNIFRFKSHHQAYLHIIFEKEAYTNEHNLRYLSTRKTFACFKR